MKSFKIAVFILLVAVFTYTISNLKIEEQSDETSSYISILTGDFSSINDTDCKENMNYLYNAEMSDGKCDWKYLIRDFNSDGTNDLFIQLSDTFDSALFTYENGYAKWIYIDSLEANCFMFPLKDGRFVEVYDYWTAPTTTVFELDSDFNWINVNQYIKSDQEEIISNMDQEYGVVNDDSSDQKFRYYLKSSNGEKRGMDEVEWNCVQNKIDEEKSELLDVDEL